MLENDFVGQRSGIRKVCGSAVSQNQRNVRRSRSSSVERGATARLLGASAAEWQATPRRSDRTANAAHVRRTSGLEVHFQTELFATSETDHAIRLAEVRSWIARPQETAETAVVGEVESVEDFRDHADARPAERVEVLLQAEVDVAKSEAATLRRIDGPGDDAGGQSAGKIESLGEVEIGRGRSGAQRDARAEAHVPRDAEDPGGAEVIRLGAGNGMLRIVGRARQVEAEEVISVLLGLGMGVDEVRAPLGLGGVGPIDDQALSVVPETLADGIVENDRSKPGSERPATRS